MSLSVVEVYADYAGIKMDIIGMQKSIEHNASIIGRLSEEIKVGHM